MSAEHSMDLGRDENGWWWATCGCGWQQGPYPNQSDAGDSWADHVQATAVEP